MIIVNIFSQAFIDGLLSILKPPTSFLRDTFWTGAPETHEVDQVIVDVEVDGQKIAAIVSSEDDPVKIARTGYGTRMVKTPKILMITDLKPRDFMDHRQPGQAGITDTSDPKFKQRVEDELGKMLRRFQDMRTRMEEWMAAQALLNGKWEITLPQNGKKYKIDFLRPETHNVILSGDALWSATTTADPLKVIDTKSTLIVQGAGVQPTHVIMNKATKNALLACTKFIEALNKLNVNRGLLDTTAADLQNGARKFAEVDGYQFYEYDATYEDYSGANQLYIPDGDVILAAKHAGNVRHYGPVEDFDAMPDVRRVEFSKNWTEKMPSKWNLSYESHPLLAMHRPQASVRLKVLA